MATHRLRRWLGIRRRSTARTALGAANSKGLLLRGSAPRSLVEKGGGGAGKGERGMDPKGGGTRRSSKPDCAV